MGPRQCPTLFQRLPRNGRNLSALHGGKLLVELNFGRVHDVRDKVDVALEDAVGAPEGLHQCLFRNLDGLARDVGFFVELAKGALEVRLAPHASALGEAPLRIGLGRRMRIEEGREV